MQGGGFNKTGWHWTRKGWKRTPKRLQIVKKIAGTKKRRPFKKVPIPPAEAEKPPTFAKARKLAAEKGRAVSALTPAPEIEKPARRPPRKAWGGKYDDISKPHQDRP